MESRRNVASDKRPDHVCEIVHGCSKWAAITTAAVAPVLALTGGVPGWLVVYGVASAAAWAATRRRRRG
jgi:hypothetical protein